MDRVYEITLQLCERDIVLAKFMLHFTPLLIKYIDDHWCALCPGCVGQLRYQSYHDCQGGYSDYIDEHGGGLLALIDSIEVRKAWSSFTESIRFTQERESNLSCTPTEFLNENNVEIVRVLAECYPS